MADSKKFKELLKRYSIARIPFIAINTIESPRALAILKEVSEDMMQPFFVHSLSKGFYDISTERQISDERSVFGALEYIGDQMRRKQYMTFVLTETPALGSDNADARQLLELANLADETGGVIIVLTNSPVWNQLQRLGMLVHLDLPTEEEMYVIVKDYVDDYRAEIPVEWDDADVREVASLLTGVTKIEAINVIAALIANRSITKADIDEVRAAKDRLFSDISGLEKIEVDENVKDVGGLAGLRKWLDEKKALLSPECS